MVIINNLPTVRAVCEGDAPGPPVEAPRLSEVNSSIQQKKVGDLSFLSYPLLQRYH